MKPGLIHRVFPFLEWLPAVSRNTLKADFVAGVTGAVIVLPQGVAFALIAGLPPIYGLYTAMITPVVAALFGSSKHLISGPTTAISIVVFTSLNPLAEPFSQQWIQLALVITFIAGAIQLFLGLARLGTLVNFVSHSVVVGFTAGAAILITAKQMRHVFGIEIPGGSSFSETMVVLATKIEAFNPYVLAISIFTLVIAILVKRLYKPLPNLLIAMILGSVLSLVLDGSAHGVALIGALPAGLPPVSIPAVSLGHLRQLGPNAFAIALLGLIEAVAISRSIATKSHQRIDGNQEFIGQGLSNIVGSFFSSYAGSGSFTRSGINYESGAKTPLSAVFAAIVLVFILLLVAPLAAYLPIPAMAGIIMYVAYKLIDFAQVRQILMASKRETAVLIITFLSTLFFDLQYAIYFGVFFSLVLYLRSTSKPRVVELAPNPNHYRRKFENVALSKLVECPQLKVIRVDGSLFFGAIDHVTEELRRFASSKNILIICSGINLIDVAGAELLLNEANRLRASGGNLFLSSLKYRGREMLKKGNYWGRIGRENIFSTKDEAIRTIFERLDPNICLECRARIFHECQHVGNN